MSKDKRAERMAAIIHDSTHYGIKLMNQRATRMAPRLMQARVNDFCEFLRYLTDGAPFDFKAENTDRGYEDKGSGI